MDHVGRALGELDLGVGRDDERGLPPDASDDAPPRLRIVEAPLPLEGGDVDPELRPRGDRVHARLGREGRHDEQHDDHADEARVDRLHRLRLVASPRPFVPAPPVADDREDDGRVHDRGDGDHQPLVAGEESRELVTRVDHGRGHGTTTAQTPPP